MHILIVSDSHGINEALRSVILKEKPEMLIHLGDSEYSQEEIASWAGSPKTPCVFVKGNCDSSSCDPSLVKDEAVFNLKGHRFYCTHGHRQRVNYGLLILSLTAQEKNCDICLFGHTHIPYDSYGEAISDCNKAYGSDNIPSGPHILNPGSISLPRGGSGKSYMIMDMDDDGRYNVKYCEI